MEPMMASIMLFAGNYAPRNWAFCDGQLLPINQYSALFSLLGTTYGGDGRTTFGLPDLRGRVPLGPRQGPGLSNNYDEGAKGGVQTNILNIAQMPKHNHSATLEGTQVGSVDIAIPVLLDSGNTPEPGSDVVLAKGEDPNSGAEINMYSTGPADSTLKPFPATVSLSGGGSVTIGMTGNNQPINNMQPFTAINYIIALQGYFPLRV